MINQNEIILEFISLGAYVKINAIDTKTGVEATAIAPANLRRDEMKTLALRKLEYVMKKKKNSDNDFLV
jgi:hypothetical protein